MLSFISSTSDSVNQNVLDVCSVINIVKIRHAEFHN